MLDFTEKSVILGSVMREKFIPREFVPVKHLFVPREKTEKKDLTFKPKSETINAL